MAIFHANIVQDLVKIQPTSEHTVEEQTRIPELIKDSGTLK